MFKINKGIVLEQSKEPALSAPLKEFLGADFAPSYINSKPLNRDVFALNPEQIITICKEAHIIDESDGKPLWEKLDKVNKSIVNTVIADAIDDEPYISSQINPALNLPDEFTMGLNIAMGISGAKQKYVAVYKNMGDLKIKIPPRINEIEVKLIHGKYPAEYTAKKSLHGKGQLIIGACALIHLYRACHEDRIQTTAFITLAGSCVSNPVNLEVPIGMAITRILERSPLIFDPARVVVGGSMTGTGVIDTDTVFVDANTRGVLVFKEQFKKYNFNCIGCGKCVSSCPTQLSPNYIYRHICKNQKKYLKMYDVDQCIGCGICSYICPAKLDLSDTIYEYAKEQKQPKKNHRRELASEPNAK